MTRRLAWLDALRGLGATAVLVEHLNYHFLDELRPRWMNLGIYGVLVFFLVSGYIIPASLERRGDVPAFWISRVFRLYPLYLLLIAVTLALSPLLPLRGDVNAVAHLTMLMEVTGSAGMVEPMWTLSYEMVFYLLVTGLFVAGVHRRSGWFALAFALLATLVAFTLPREGHLLDGPWAPVAVLVVAAVGLGCVLFGSRSSRTAGAVLLAVLAVALIWIGSRESWQGAMILAVMFTGTAIHRWERAQGSGLWPVAGVAALILLVPFLKPVTFNGLTNLATMGLAAATFALFFALRGRELPRVLAWLGLISYSVYLVHVPLIKLALLVIGDPGRLPWPAQLGLGLALLALILGVSWLTYRFVELPAQRYGRRLIERRAAARELIAA
ncbi:MULTISPECIES: acyltransferase family protein [Nonomuraea]|uniref:Acyltransferase family protein n=1 Tax=Nonomuraea mangrovi TaxID=2316207 RepID=A0ABW4SRZ7_9ACTN